MTSSLFVMFERADALQTTLGRGRVSYLFYWFSICEALHIYTVCDCTRLIAQAGNQIANHFTCYYTLHVVAGNSQCVTAWAERCWRNADNLLAVLPTKQRRCAKQYHLISPQCSSQACQPDSPQSLRIHTPGLLQPSDSFWSCYAQFENLGSLEKMLVFSRLTETAHLKELDETLMSAW